MTHEQPTKIFISYYARIDGQNGQVFTATRNGNYAVEIKDVNGCIDTSICYKAIVVGVRDESFGSSFYVYPNPTSANFVLDFGEPLKTAEIIVANIFGQEISRAQCRNTSEFNLVITGEKGIYLLIVRSENKVATIRILKQ